MGESSCDLQEGFKPGSGDWPHDSEAHGWPFDVAGSSQFGGASQEGDRQLIAVAAGTSMAFVDAAGGLRKT
jgi:hypothetical protein